MYNPEHIDVICSLSILVGYALIMKGPRKCSAPPLPALEPCQMQNSDSDLVLLFFAAVSTPWGSEVLIMYSWGIVLFGGLSSRTCWSCWWLEP